MWQTPRILSCRYKQVESFSARREWGIKLSVLGVLGVMFAIWAKYVYMQGKNGYNSIHSYYGIIPLLTYLFVRNISVTVLGGVELVRNSSYLRATASAADPSTALHAIKLIENWGC